MMNKLVLQGEISNKILTFRSQQVILDKDLAELYHVETKVLNQAVKRNIKRFPSDFLFQINDKEKNELVTNCDRFKMLKHSTVNPYVFTEEGIYMLAAVLKSDIAIEVNIEIIRTFKKLREFSKHYNALTKKIIELERKNDKQFKEVFERLGNIVHDTKKLMKKSWVL